MKSAMAKGFSGSGGSLPFGSKHKMFLKCRPAVDSRRQTRNKKLFCCFQKASKFVCVKKSKK
jgi:hypothetical protein